MNLKEVVSELAESIELESGEEAIKNPERGCGFLKPDKAYARLDGIPGGEMPTFVEIANESNRIPYKGDHFRNYRWIPGISFELALIEEAADLGPSSSPMELVSALKNNEVTDPPGEVWDHIRRLAGSEGWLPDQQFTAGRTGRAHDLLMWVGGTYYPEPEEFINECKAHGLNKAIPVSKNQEPPIINPGRTRMWLIHPRGRRAEENLDAVEIEALSDTPGVGAKTLNILRENGYNTVREVRDAATSELAEIDGVGEDTAEAVRRAEIYVPAIIGYSYLSRIVYTRDVDGKVPDYVEDWDAANKLDLVHVGPASPYDADQAELPEWEGHEEAAEAEEAE